MASAVIFMLIFGLFSLPGNLHNPHDHRGEDNVDGQLNDEIDADEAG